MLKNINIDLVYQPILTRLPISQEEMQTRACSNDGTTTKVWKDTWLRLFLENQKEFGPFRDRHVGKLYGKEMHRPVIVLGSGPSLGEQIEDLKENAKLDHPICTVSALHNFPFLHKHNCHANYYVTLDSGAIVLSDMVEGHEEYDIWEATKDKVLIAYVGTHPEVLRKWKGPIYFYNSAVPDEETVKKMDEAEKFPYYFVVGGNVSGAALYFAKCVLACGPLILVGVDCCFSYDNKFHSYPTQYDQTGDFVLHPDVFGVPRKTWLSYVAFKHWFDRVASTMPGIWINSSFGIVGAYMGGNIGTWIYKPLKNALEIFSSNEKVVVNVVKKDDNGQVKQQMDTLLLKSLWSDENEIAVGLL